MASPATCQFTRRLPETPCCRKAASVLPYRFARLMPFALAFFLLAGAAAASELPKPYNTEPDSAGPMPAAEAAAKMTLPPGFKATVFAAEPDIQNPIAMTWDGRGRLWVAENYTYAEAPLKF